MTDKPKQAPNSAATAGHKEPPGGAAPEPHGQPGEAEPIDITDPRFSKRAEANGAATGGHEPQAEDAGAATGGKPSYVAELEAKLADREARLEATLGQYKDALDEFNNVKARLTRDVAKEIQAGKKSLLVGLLEVVDNLERALSVAQQDPAQAKTPLCEGITMVRDQFHAKLTAAGVHKQPALGQPFDPYHFEAISNVPVTDREQDGRVVGVVREAYKLGEEVLRHGIVAVGKLQA